MIYTTIQWLKKKGEKDKNNDLHDNTMVKEKDEKDKNNDLHDNTMVKEKDEKN